MATTTMIATFSTFMNNHFAEINANFDNLNARLDNIERACPKVDAEYDVHKVIDNWQKKFDDEFFNNGYAPITNIGTPTAANSSSSPLLPCATVPSLPAAPRSEHATSSAAMKDRKR